MANEKRKRSIKVEARTRLLLEKPVDPPLQGGASRKAAWRAASQGRGAVWGKKNFATFRLLDRHVFDDVEQCLTTALLTARADGGSASPAPLDFCKARLWQVTDASTDLRDPNPN